MWGLRPKEVYYKYNYKNLVLSAPSAPLAEAVREKGVGRQGPHDPAVKPEHHRVETLPPRKVRDSPTKAGRTTWCQVTKFGKCPPAAKTEKKAKAGWR